MSRRLAAALIFTGALAGLVAALVFRPTLPSALPLIGDDAAFKPSTEPAPNPYLKLVAQAKPALTEIEVFDAPRGAIPRTTLKNPNENGVGLVFLVEDQEREWFRVLLPIRPNGAQGWIRARDVTTLSHEYRIVISLAAHKITVYHRDGIFLQEPVGIGKGPTPTPLGVFYTKELLQPPNPNTAYGVYAYGLSGYSNVLNDFQGGDGVVGVHGTNDPSTLGKDVSHGCIRMSNAGITRLAKSLPLGVPVVIEP